MLENLVVPGRQQLVKAELRRRRKLHQMQQHRLAVLLIEWMLKQAQILLAQRRLGQQNRTSLLILKRMLAFQQHPQEFKHKAMTMVTQ
jgi:hypothetical protein